MMLAAGWLRVESLGVVRWIIEPCTACRLYCREGDLQMRDRKMRDRTEWLNVRSGGGVGARRLFCRSCRGCGEVWLVLLVHSTTARAWLRPRPLITWSQAVGGFFVAVRCCRLKCPQDHRAAACGRCRGLGPAYPYPAWPGARRLDGDIIATICQDIPA